MTNQVADILKIIQSKTRMTMEEIAVKTGYTRPYLQKAKKDGGNEKLINILKETFSEVLQNDTEDFKTSTFSANLQLIRKVSEYNESAFAYLIGTHANEVTAMELGHVVPDPRTMHRIAKLANIKLGDLLKKPLERADIKIMEGILLGEHDKKDREMLLIDFQEKHIQLQNDYIRDQRKMLDNKSDIMIMLNEFRSNYVGEYATVVKKLQSFEEAMAEINAQLEGFTYVVFDALSRIEKRDVRLYEEDLKKKRKKEE